MDIGLGKGSRAFSVEMTRTFLFCLTQLKKFFCLSEIKVEFLNLVENFGTELSSAKI